MHTGNGLKRRLKQGTMWIAKFQRTQKPVLVVDDYLTPNLNLGLSLCMGKERHGPSARVIQVTNVWHCELGYFSRVPNKGASCCPLDTISPWPTSGSNGWFPLQERQMCFLAQNSLEYCGWRQKKRTNTPPTLRLATGDTINMGHTVKAKKCSEIIF